MRQHACFAGCQAFLLNNWNHAVCFVFYDMSACIFASVVLAFCLHLILCIKDPFQMLSRNVMHCCTQSWSLARAGLQTKDTNSKMGEKNAHIVVQNCVHVTASSTPHADHLLKTQLPVISHCILQFDTCISLNMHAQGFVGKGYWDPYACCLLFCCSSSLVHAWFACHSTGCTDKHTCFLCKIMQSPHSWAAVITLGFSSSWCRK